MSAELIQHVIFTRFSVRIGDATVPQPRAWIDERIALLERFTLPSIRAQQSADFTWRLLCDVQTDPDVAEHLRALDPRIRLAMIGPKPEHGAVRAQADMVADRWRIDGAIRPETTTLIQTRLDSDDAIHPAFLQDVTDEMPIFLVSGSQDWLRVAACGYQYDVASRRLYRRIFPRGPFQSYYQRIVPGRPPLQMPANHGAATLTTVGLASYERWSWLQVVHGGNIHNRIFARNEELDVAGIGRVFGIDL